MPTSEFNRRVQAELRNTIQLVGEDQKKINYQIKGSETIELRLDWRLKKLHAIFVWNLFWKLEMTQELVTVSDTRKVDVSRMAFDILLRPNVYEKLH